MISTVVISTVQIPDIGRTQEIAQYVIKLAGVSVMHVPLLYHLPEASPLWKELAVLPDNCVVLAEMYPRATQCLLQNHGVSSAICLDLRSSDIEITLANLLEGQQETAGSDIIISGDTYQRWYPVLDNERCQQCGHCLQFCLFGVYSKNEAAQILVSNPDACKPGCPACSRICPHGAIIFPLYSKEPAIAGAPGQYMVPDFAARKLYYQRTRLTCPACGLSGPINSAETLPCCEECGRPLPPSSSVEPDDTFDDLDALVDELDNLPTRRQ